MTSAAAAGSAAAPRVALVGLGAIGRVHLAVLRSLPDVEVVLTVDPAVAGPADVPHVPRLADALGGGDAEDLADLVVLATPTDLHLALAGEVLDRTSALVLSEKPLTRDGDALDRFLRSRPDAAQRLRVVDHFGFSPEVEWGARYARDRAWGPPVGLFSSFTDPYAGRSAEQRRSLVSPWVDSGANQLSVLSRFVGAWAVAGQACDDAGDRAVTEVDWAGGAGTLVASWATGDSSKHTRLTWDDGRSLHLDHTSMTGVATEDGRVVEHLGHDATLDRKGAHYTGLYRALLADPGHPLLSLTAALRVARTLAAAPSAWQGAGPRWTTRSLDGPRS